MAQLFGQYDIFSVREDIKQKLVLEVDKLDPNYLLNASEDDLVRAIASEFQLHVPVVDFDAAHTAEFREIEMEARPSIYNDWQQGYVKGIRITIAIPFEGDPDFFSIKPSTFTYGGETPDDAHVGANQLELIYTRADTNADALKRSYESYFGTLKQDLLSLRQNSEEINSSLESHVRGLIQRRKANLVAQGKMVDALGLPIKRRQGMPTTYAVPVTKRKPKIARPAASSGTREQEPFLDMLEYENVLNIMRNMVRVMEQSPRALMQWEKKIYVHISLFS